KRFGPRGVLHSYADGKIEDTGPLTKKRMETVDEEFLAGALDFIDRQQKAGKPFFVWFNSTRMHVFTHLKAESQGKTGLGTYPDGMVEHDGMVGQLLKKLDDLGIADNTIVVYGTDNGAEVMSWPDGGTTPYRGEKATNWEGGYRTPCLIRWPGVIKPGTIYNDFFAHEDFLPTFCAACGDPDVVAKCAKGYTTGGKTFKVHLDGYNLMPFFKGEVKESPRKEFLYWSDDGDLFAVRLGPLKITLLSSTIRVSTSGERDSNASAFRIFTTCAPTRLSAEPSRLRTTGVTSLPAGSLSCRRKPWLASGLKVLRNIPSVRNLRASISTK